MKRVIIIGGGASGIIAALKASRNNEVIILEKENKIGKKILVTGNGRCNLWNKLLNEDIDLSDYYYTDNYDVLNKLFTKRSEVFNYLVNDLRITMRNKDIYMYPYSNSAVSIRELLERTLINHNVDIITNFNVSKIEKNDNKYLVYNTNNEYYECDNVVISCGMMATNPDNTLYKSLFDDLIINPVYPSLVPIELEDNYLGDWAGIRAEGAISFNSESISRYEVGEIMLTDYGISGIAAFNLSGYVNRALNIHQDFEMSIDFMHDYSEVELKNKFLNNIAEDVLETIFNYKLMFILLKKANIKKDEIINETNVDGLINVIKHFRIVPTGTKGFDRCQVVTGGISLNEVNEKLELKKHPGIYLTGEILDIDAYCGGFNLASAFITGFIVGDALND